MQILIPNLVRIQKTIQNIFSFIIRRYRETRLLEE